MKNVNHVTLNVKLVMFMTNVHYVLLIECSTMNLFVIAQLVIMKVLMEDVINVIIIVIPVTVPDIATVPISECKTKIVNVHLNTTILINIQNVSHVTKNVPLVSNIQIVTLVKLPLMESP
jgi:hypothetical protein